MAPVGMHSFVYRKNGQASNIPTSPQIVESVPDRRQRAQNARVSKDDLKAAKQNANVSQRPANYSNVLPNRQTTYNYGSHGVTQAESQGKSINGGLSYIADTQAQDRRSPSLSDTTQDEQQRPNLRSAHVDILFQPSPGPGNRALDATALYNAAHSTLYAKAPTGHVTVVEETQFDSQYPSTSEGAGSEGAQRAETHSTDASAHEDDYRDDEDESGSNQSDDDDEEDDGLNEATARVIEPDRHLIYQNITNGNSSFRPSRDSHHQQPPQQYAPQYETPQLHLLPERPPRITALDPAGAQNHESIFYHQKSVSQPAQHQTSDPRLPSPSSLTKPKLSAGYESRGEEADKANEETNTAADESEAGDTPVPASKKSEKRRGSNASLDYEGQKLFTMDFRMLLKEEFDHIPQAYSSSFPQNMLPETLHKQFAHVATLGRQEQQTYFASLAKADWEQAGDWFVKQYDHLMREMRKRRGEKRKIAREFEEEVARRHETVSEEKRGLDNSLKKMKSSGTTILAFGTPKGKAP